MQNVSPELERLLPTISSGVHRKALLAIDQLGLHAVKWKRGFTALHWAAKTGRTDIYEYLISKGADAGLKDEDGKTAADYACMQTACSLPKNLPPAHQKAVDAIERIGWANVKWAGGWTLLHWGFQAGRPDVIAYCQSKGVPLTIKDAKGNSPQFYKVN